MPRGRVMPRELPESVCISSLHLLVTNLRDRETVRSRSENGHVAPPTRNGVVDIFLPEPSLMLLIFRLSVSASVDDLSQIALPHFLPPHPLLLLLLHPFQLLFGSPSKYVDGPGDFIAHALSPSSLRARAVSPSFLAKNSMVDLRFSPQPL